MNDPYLMNKGTLIGEVKNLERMLSLKQDDWIEACGEIDDLKKQLEEAKTVEVTVWSKDVNNGEKQKIRISRMEHDRLSGVNYSQLKGKLEQAQKIISKQEVIIGELIEVAEVHLDHTFEKIKECEELKKGLIS